MCYAVSFVLSSMDCKRISSRCALQACALDPPGPTWVAGKAELIFIAVEGVDGCTSAVLGQLSAALC
jgi:hypothetical protein